MAVTTFRPQPVAPDAPCTLEVICLDGRDVLRVKQEGRAIGYFANPTEAAAHGVDLATAVIIGG